MFMLKYAHVHFGGAGVGVRIGATDIIGHFHLNRIHNQHIT